MIILSKERIIEIIGEENYELITGHLWNFYQKYKDVDFYLLIISVQDQKIITAIINSMEEAAQKDLLKFINKHYITPDKLIEQGPLIGKNYNINSYNFPKIVFLDLMRPFIIELLPLLKAFRAGIGLEELDKKYSSQECHMDFLKPSSILTQSTHYYKLIQPDFIPIICPLINPINVPTMLPIKKYNSFMSKMMFLTREINKENENLFSDALRAVDFALMKEAANNYMRLQGYIDSCTFLTSHTVIEIPKWDIPEFIKKCNETAAINEDTLKQALAQRIEEGFATIQGNSISLTYQTLFLAPMYYEAYLPVLDEIFKLCKDAQLDLETEVKCAMAANPDGGHTASVDEILWLANFFQSINQMPGDWNFFYSSHYNQESFKASLKRSINYIQAYKNR